MKSTRKAGDGLPALTGYASVFYDGDEGSEYELWSYAGERCVERIQAGAFDRALREKDDVRALFNHSPDAVLGRTAAGTLRLSTDAKGLRYAIDLPDTELARSLVESVRRGDVAQSSFAFVVDEQTFRETKGADGGVLVIREVNSVTLVDVSPVTYPAYGNTTCSVSGSSSRAVLPIGLSMRLDAVRERARRVSTNEHFSYRGNYMSSSIERAVGPRDAGAIVTSSRESLERKRQALAERRAALPTIFPEHSRRAEEVDIMEAEAKLRESIEALARVEARAARRNRTG